MTRALYSEWTKLRALRSTAWTLGATVLLTIIFTVLITSGSSTDGCPEGGMGCDDDLMEMSLAGVYLGQLAIAALGVMTISSEFTSGMIRTTFAATPRRHEVLAAKAIVLGAVVFAAGLVACLPAYLLGLSLLQSNGFDATYGYAAPTFAETVRGVGGTAVYLAALALLGIGIGAILRHTAAAISALLGLLWVPLMLVWMLPMDVGLKVARFCPMIAGLAIQRTVERSDTVPISPVAGLALFCAYAAAALAAGMWLVGRRDA